MLPPEDARRYEVLARALEADPARRPDVVREACGTDDALRDEILALLARREAIGDFLCAPAAARLDLLAPSGPPLAPGTPVGRYVLARVIASGGSGTVYEAWQESPRRRVALKVMSLGLGSTRAAHRLREEAEILARLSHPGIAHVYEAGTHESGGVRLPWLALEHVEGARDLVTYAGALPLRARIGLLAQVCDAVHHGHEHGILHGDLKPSNLLVDAAGRLKVIDFGVARVIGAEGEPSIAGTPAYMSPELCEPGDARPDVRSDVFALGAVGYELLCGRPAADVADLPLPEALDAARTRSPVRLERLAPRLRGDVAAIVHKALARRPEDRYASASAMADDLRRHLAHWPVAARPPSVAYQARRFVRRNPALAAALAGMVVVAVGAAVVSRREASATERALHRVERGAYATAIALAEGALHVGDAAAARRALRNAPERFRGWEWALLAGRVDGSRSFRRGPGDGGMEARFVPGDRQIVGASNLHPLVEGGYVCLWDARTGAEVARSAPLGAFAGTPVASADGRSVAWAQGGDLALAGPDLAHRTLRQPAPVVDLDVHPRRPLLAAAVGREVRLLALPDGEPVGRLAKGNAFALSVGFDPAGDTVAVGSTDGSVRVWDHANEREVVAVACTAEADAVALRAGWLACAARDGTLRCWLLADGPPALTLRHRGERAHCVALADDGRVLASGHGDGTIVLWDTARGERLATLVGHDDVVSSVQFAADGHTLLSSSFDGTWRTWDADARGEVALGRHRRLVRGLAFRPDGTEIACASFDGAVHVYDASTRERIAEVALGQDVVQCMAYGSREIYASGRDGRIVVVDPRRGEVTAAWPAHGAGVRCLAAQRAGPLLASGGGDATLRVWDTRTRREVHREVMPPGVGAAAFAPDGGRLAFSGGVAEPGVHPVRVLDCATWRVVADLRHEAPVPSLAFSPDGARLATGMAHGALRIWNLGTGTFVESVAARQGVDAIAFHRDGARLALAAGRAVQVWDTAAPARLLTLRGSVARFYDCAFSPDGRTLAAGGGDGSGADCGILLWGPEPGEAWPAPLPAE